MSNDTIVALATAPGESAVALTRLSGPSAIAIASAHFRGRQSPLHSRSHRILHGSFVGSDGIPLDRVLLSVFRAPHSYTGDDIVEISSHGGTVVPSAIVRALIGSGARPARPGEFTERAFRGGKLDLAQAESVAALIRARSERSLRAAHAALGGSISRRVNEIDGDLVRLLAEVESRIDFPADVGDPLDGPELARRCGVIAATLRDWVAGLPSSRRAREGVRAALVGKPNVGKSSVLNALVGYDRAIVDRAPGTTRDTVEEAVWFAGVELRLVDTAGIRSAADGIERLGMERSTRAAEECDLAVLVLDRSSPVEDHDRTAASLAGNRPVIVVWNKADLANGGRREWVREGGIPGAADPLAEVETVAVRPGGIQPLRDALETALPRVLADHPGEEIATTSARQEGLLLEALGSIERAAIGLHEDRSYDLIAVDLADARRLLAEIVGRGVDDGLVAEIFARFCIGK